MTEDFLRTVPTTRYQGSKRKILPWLYDCINEYEFHSVLDAFGGSGMVSYLFKRMGKRVTYNDLYRFNHTIGESIIENNRILLSESDVVYLLSSSKNRDSFIHDNFQGIYYLDEENQWLDQIIQNIESLEELYDGKKLKFKKAIAYNALFQSCLAKRPYNLFHRKNLEMRTRHVQRGFGNKTTWDKPFYEHFQSFVNEINKSVYYSKEFSLDVLLYRISINFNSLIFSVCLKSCQAIKNCIMATNNPAARLPNSPPHLLSGLSV